MSQKTNPISLRLGYLSNWKGQWFGDKHSSYDTFIHQDLALTEYVETVVKRRTKNFYLLGAPIIKRYPNKVLISSDVWCSKSTPVTKLQDIFVNENSFKPVEPRISRQSLLSEDDKNVKKSQENKKHNKHNLTLNKVTALSEKYLKDSNNNKKSISAEKLHIIMLKKIVNNRPSSRVYVPSLKVK